MSTAAGATPALRKGGLSLQGEEILRAVAPVILGPLLPSSPRERLDALDAAMWAVDDYVAHLSRPLQDEAARLLALMHTTPARLLLLGTTARWCEASPARVEAFLRRARHSRIRLLRRVFDFLHSLTVIAWFDLPEAWHALGYPGPPLPRPFFAGYEG